MRKELEVFTCPHCKKENTYLTYSCITTEYGTYNPRHGHETTEYGDSEGMEYCCPDCGCVIGGNLEEQFKDPEDGKW